MANQLNFSIQQKADRLNIDFKSLTGAYASDNVGGWGSPNPATASATSAVLIITARGSDTSYTINLTPDGFPTTDKTKTKTIPYTDFGGATDEKIPNKIFNFEYKVVLGELVGAPVVHTDKNISLLGGLKCCLKKLRQNINVPNCDLCKCRGECKCEFKEIRNVGILQTLYNSVCLQVNCNKLDKAEKTIAYLERYCNCHCKSC